MRDNQVGHCGDCRAVYFVWQCHAEAAPQLFCQHPHALDTRIERSVDENASYRWPLYDYCRILDAPALRCCPVEILHLLGGATDHWIIGRLLDFILLPAFQKRTGRSTGLSVKNIASKIYEKTSNLYRTVHCFHQLWLRQNILKPTS